jgi:hypothetical protein
VSKTGVDSDGEFSVEKACANKCTNLHRFRCRFFLNANRELNLTPSDGPSGRAWRWFSVDFLGIFREMRLSYLRALMVYLAAGVSGFTGIIWCRPRSAATTP